MPTPYAPAGGRAMPRRAASRAQEAVRHLQEQPRAVARRLVAADRAAVLEVDEHAHAQLDHLVPRHAVEARDEADAAVAALDLPVDQAPPRPLDSPLVPIATPMP